MNNVKDCTKEEWDRFLLDTKDRLEKNHKTQRIKDVEDLLSTAQGLGDYKLVQELTSVKDSLQGVEAPDMQPSAVAEILLDPDEEELQYYREGMTSIIEALWKITENDVDASRSPGTLEFLEFRSVVCDMRSLESEYWERFGGRIPYLEDATRTANEVKGILGDNTPCVFLSSSFDIKSADWKELSMRYKVLVQARAAMDWFLVRGECLSNDQVRRLLDSIGGAQQAFKRRIELYNMRDYFQKDLYEAVKSASKSKHYLKALVSNTSMEEILHLASDLNNAFEDAFNTWRQFHVKNESKAEAIRSRNEILLELKTLLEEPQFSAPKNRKNNKERLFSVLQKWRLAKFPASDPEFRELLLDHLDTFLKDSSEYKDMYNEGVLERGRRTPADSNSEGIGQIRKVAAMLKNKSIVIFGSPVEGSLERNLQKLLSAKSVVLLPTQETVPTAGILKQYDIAVVFTERISGKFQQELERATQETNTPVIRIRAAQSVSNLVDAFDTYYTLNGD